MRSVRFGAIASIAVAMPLAAQLRVETGGGQAHLDQLPASSLTALGGSLDALLGGARIQFAGNAEDHIGLGMAGIMSGGLHYRFTPGGWNIEAGPVSDVARGIEENWVGTLAADLRASREIGRLSVYAGWQQGTTLTGSQSSWHRPSAGAGFRFGAVQVAASWQATVAPDSVLNTTGFFPRAALIDTLYRAQVRDIQDLGVRMAWSAGPLSLSARIGRRFGLNILPQTWWDGHAALHLTPIMSVTMRTGRLASDALLGLRGGQYTTLGLQLDLLQHAKPADRHVAFAPAEFLRESPATVHIFFVLPPGTRRATLVSDLTEWHAIDLARSDDGRWEIVLHASAGVYRLNISTDGGPWRAPTGLPVIEDGFGTKAGLLVLDK
jgi:hypothetical protein